MKPRSQHLKECHINDGIAMTKFMYWLKTNVGKLPMTERTISDRLEEERKKLARLHRIKF
ncbi:MAG: hypothetical protein ACLUTF_04640 [Anaerostipes hadrus]